MSDRPADLPVAVPDPIQQFATHLLGSVLTWGGVKELIGTDLYDRAVLALRSLDDLWDERAALLVERQQDKKHIEGLYRKLTSYIVQAARDLLQAEERNERLTGALEEVEAILDLLPAPISPKLAATTKHLLGKARRTVDAVLAGEGDT